MLDKIGWILQQVGDHPVGSRDRLGTYGRILSWQLRSRLSTEVEHRWIGDARLAVRSGMHGATGNIYYGLYEFADMTFILNLLRPDDHFVDIGANVGVYTVLASKLCGARTTAFEPAAETLPALRKNIALNGLGDRVDVHEVALGSSNGEVSFTVGLDCVNHVEEAGGTGGRVVPIRRLDDVLRGSTPVLMKIDVEGFEHEVIAGAQEVLSQPGLLAIEVETVDPATRGPIEAAGFVEVFYDPARRLLCDAPTGVAASNSLFVRDREAVAERLRTAPARQVHGVSI